MDLPVTPSIRQVSVEERYSARRRLKGKHAARRSQLAKIARLTKQNRHTSCTEGNYIQPCQRLKRQDEYCQLCVQTKEDCVPLRGVIKKMLRILAPRWNVEAYAEAPVCEKCIETFTSLFKQKTMWLRTNKIIMRYVKRSKGNLDLKTMIRSCDLRNFQVCRYCLKMQFDYQLYSYCADLRDNLMYAVPEVDTRVANNPIICRGCCITVNSLVTFLKSLEFPDKADKCPAQDVTETDRNGDALAEDHQIKPDLLDIEVVEETIKLEPEDTKLVEQDKHFASELDSNDSTSATYCCVICSFSTKVLDLYVAHVIDHNPEQDVTVTKAKNGARYPCSACGYTTTHKYNLKSHMQIHGKYGDGAKCLIACAICSGKFENIRSLGQHYRRIHNQTRPYYSK